jgi:hypothetical protein
LRKAVQSTMEPSSIRLVASASAAQIVMTSRMSPEA